MALRVPRSAILLAAIVLSGCQTGSSGYNASTSVAEGAGQTGTSTVRQRVAQLRSDQTALAASLAGQAAALNSVRGQISSDAQAYNSLVGTITSRLYAGTTPGNPELVAAWNNAQAKLDAVTLDVGQLNSLASQVTTEASVAGYLLDNERATFLVGGAVDEDHVQLRSIEADTNSSIQTTDRLITDLNGEIARQNGFLSRERANLAGLSYGVNLGRLGSPSVRVPAPRRPNLNYN